MVVVSEVARIMAGGIQNYYGEFLVNVIPLELSLIEPCDYACAYCFAVLGARDLASRKGSNKAKNRIKTAANLIQNVLDSKTTESKLLRKGYPVLMSNRTDPFGRANRMASVPLMEIMVEMGIPIAIQTKGFTFQEDKERVLEFMPPCVWYISIAFDNDEIVRKIEPGAPLVSHRLNLISELVDRGHGVVVGINPCVPEFLPDPRPLLKELKERGVWGVWIARLHLSHWQEKQMTEREKKVLGSEVIRRAKMGETHQKDLDHYYLTRYTAIDLGLEVFGMHQEIASNFWDIYRYYYPKTFPTNQDFINLCYLAELKDGDLIAWETYRDFIYPSLPKGIKTCGKYVGAVAIEVCREFEKNWGQKWTDNFGYEKLLQIMWVDSRIKPGLVNSRPFSYACLADRKGNLVPLVDDKGMPLLAWKASGHSDLYVDVEKLTS